MRGLLLFAFALLVVGECTPHIPSRTALLLDELEHALEELDFDAWAASGSCTPPTVSTVLSARGALPVNQAITQAYKQFAVIFQRIIDPTFSVRTTSAVSSWYAVAPFASREVGIGETAFTETLAALNVKVVDYGAEICAVIGPCSALKKAAINAFISTTILGVGSLGAVAMTFIIKLLTAGKSGLRAFNLETFFDSTHCGINGICEEAIHDTVVRAVDILRSMSDPVEAARSMCRAGINLLEHGNRLIFEHVGGCGEKYLIWRASVHGKCNDPIDPQLVLDSFSLPASNYRARYVPHSTSGTDKANTNALFAHVAAHLSGSNSPQTAVLKSYRCVDIMVTAFACWEKGASEIRAGRAHQHWIEWGNNMFAWCEQAEAVTPAFRPASASKRYEESALGAPPATLPTEINRETLMELLTPFVKLTMRNTMFTLDSFHKGRGAPLYFRGANWGKFPDRYLPILAGAFAKGYAHHPGSLWPLPPADPAVAM